MTALPAFTDVLKSLVLIVCLFFPDLCCYTFICPLLPAPAGMSLHWDQYVAQYWLKALLCVTLVLHRLTVCHDPLALYHSGDTLSGEEDEEADEADGDNGEDNMADNGDAPVMASGNSRSSPSLITNGTVSTGGGRNLSAAAGRLTRGKASIYADWDLNSDEGEEEDLEAFSSPPPEGEKRLTRGAKQQISEVGGLVVTPVYMSVHAQTYCTLMYALSRTHVYIVHTRLHCAQLHV